MRPPRSTSSCPCYSQAVAADRTFDGRADAARREAEQRRQLDQGDWVGPNRVGTDADRAGIARVNAIFGDATGTRRRGSSKRNSTLGDGNRL